MLHSRSVRPVRTMVVPQARAASVPLRHARLFELLRQQALAERALLRLHRRAPRMEDMPLPSPVLLAASLVDHASGRSS